MDAPLLLLDYETGCSTELVRGEPKQPRWDYGNFLATSSNKNFIIHNELQVWGWKKQTGMTTSYEWTHTEQHDKLRPTNKIVSDMLDTQEDGRRIYPLGLPCC